MRPSNPPRLLVVEDDDLLARRIVDYLGQHGFELARVASGDAGVERILATQPDLVILDLMLPGLDGLEVCRQVRHGFDGAILMLTASQREMDHVTGLELGADDFVTKPIEPRVLLARVRTQLRRLGREREHVVDQVRMSLGALQVDTATREARVDEHLVPLTATEFSVLAMLARYAGSVVERDDLYSQVLGIAYNGLDRSLDVHVSRIRRKLQHAGLDSKRIKTIRGLGYLLAIR